MTKDNIDYRSIAEDLIWRNACDKLTKNQGSWYYVVDVDGYEYRGCPKDSIQFALGFQSWIHPEEYHELTWKDLCLTLKTKGYENLISDGHDCNICPLKNTCHTVWKYDTTYERCNMWNEEYNNLKKT